MSAPGSWLPGGHRRFEVLVVCTANLCRSPMAAAVLRRRLDLLPGAWAVHSAGVDADDGRRMHHLAEQALVELGLGVDPAWRSRRLRPEDIASADLVLTATRAHRGAVVSTDHAAAGRSFTLRQFVRLLDSDAPVSSVGSAHPGDLLTARALAARGTFTPGRPEDDDLGDPIGRPYRVFRELGEQLEDLVERLTVPIATSLR